MAQPLAQAKRQKVLIAILAAVLVITAFVWYINFQKKPLEEEYVSPEQAGTAISLPLEERLKEIRLDVSALDNSLFKSLRSHGLLPVTIGEAGRENPLLPY